jgi:hypothetical protein
MPGESPGAGQGPSAEREQSQALGDGIGDSHDPNVSGAPSHISARHVDARVHGQIGAGPSRSETILGAADRGFAQTGYRQVYGDYTSVVEEVMSKHEVPPGYRYYVKRYFELIRPRE